MTARPGASETTPGAAAAAAGAAPPPAPSRGAGRAWWSRAIGSDWPAAAFAFVCFLRLPDVLLYQHGIPKVKTALVVAGCALVVARWMLLGIQPRVSRAHLLVAAAVVASALLSGIDVPDRAAWRHELGWIAKGLPVLLIPLALIDRPRAVRRVLAALVLAGALSGALTAHQHLTGSHRRTYLGLALSVRGDIDGRQVGDRAVGSIGDPNYYAQWLLAPLLVALTVALAAPRRGEAVAAALALPPIAVALVVSYSRGGWLAAAITLTALPLLVRPLRPPRARWMLAAAIAIAALSLAGATFWQRLSTLGRMVPDHAAVDPGAVTPAPAAPQEDAVGTGSAVPPERTAAAPTSAAAQTPTDYSLLYRTRQAAVALRIFRDHPLLGVGSGQMEALYPRYAPPGEVDAFRVHSLYLETATELGLVGLASLAALMLLLFGGLLRARRELIAAGALEDATWVTGIALGLTGWFAAALFLGLSYPHLLLLLLGIGLAIPGAYAAEPAATARARDPAR